MRGGAVSSGAHAAPRCPPRPVLSFLAHAQRKPKFTNDNRCAARDLVHALQVLVRHGPRLAVAVSSAKSGGLWGETGVNAHLRRQTQTRRECDWPETRIFGRLARLRVGVRNLKWQSAPSGFALVIAQRHRTIRCRIQLHARSLLLFGPKRHYCRRPLLYYTGTPNVRLGRLPGSVAKFYKNNPEN